MRLTKNGVGLGTRLHVVHSKPLCGRDMDIIGIMPHRMSVADFSKGAVTSGGWWRGLAGPSDPFFIDRRVGGSVGVGVVCAYVRV